MRPWSLSYILLGVLIFAATYRLLNQPPFPNLPADQFEASGQYPLEQKSDPLPTYKDEARLQDGDLAPANVNPDEPPIAKDEAKLEDHNQPLTDQSSDLVCRDFGPGNPGPPERPSKPRACAKKPRQMTCRGLR
jgi:hypothetical protein